MKLTLHISPTRTYSSGGDTISARLVDRVDDIASWLRGLDLDVEVVERPATAKTRSDFSLIFGSDLRWHLDSGLRAAERVVVIQADRDEILDIAETHRVAAAVFYIDPEALNRNSNGLVVQRAAVERSGGTLGPGAPYFMASEHYASWSHPSYPTLLTGLVAYLRGRRVDVVRLTIHVRPDQTSFSTARGTISMREALRCDEIADALRAAGADVRVVEGTAGDRVASDFWLVFGRDLDWHLSASDLPTERLVILDPDRGELFEIAERHRVAALVFYVNHDAWTAPTNGLIVRRDAAARLGGTLGPGAPYVMESERYAAWRDAARSSLASRLVAYLSALSQVPVVMTPKEAVEHGLVGVTVRVDANAAGMFVRPFPMPHVLVALNGPPGGPLIVMIWDCSDVPGDVEAVIRARLSTGPLAIAGPDRGFVLGQERAGMIVRTGVGQARTDWFAVIVECAAGRVLVGLGIAGRSEQPSNASTILSHQPIRAVLETLAID